MLDPATVGLWTSALIGVGAIIAGAVKFSFWMYDQVRLRLSCFGRRLTVPRETLRIALKNENAYWWHMGTQAGESTMQVVGDFSSPIFAQNRFGYRRWSCATVFGEEKGCAGQSWWKVRISSTG